MYNLIMNMSLHFVVEAFKKRGKHAHISQYCFGYPRLARYHHLFPKCAFSDFSKPI